VIFWALRPEKFMPNEPQHRKPKKQKKQKVKFKAQSIKTSSLNSHSPLNLESYALCFIVVFGYLDNKPFRISSS